MLPLHAQYLFMQYFAFYALPCKVQFLLLKEYNHQEMHLSPRTQTCVVFTLVFPEAFFQASPHRLQIYGFLQIACQWPSGLHSTPSGTLLLSSPLSPDHAFWLEKKKKKDVTFSLLIQFHVF